MFRARVLKVHPCGFYAWLKTPLSKRARDDKRRIELIKQGCLRVAAFMATVSFMMTYDLSVIDADRTV